MKNKQDTKHLEKAMFENRIASANDCTGFMVTPPETNNDSENISDFMNVPTSKHVRKRKQKN